MQIFNSHQFVVEIWHDRWIVKQVSHLVSDDRRQMYQSLLHLKCCKHQAWVACLTEGGGGGDSEPERTCIQTKANFVMLSVVCLTACFAFSCRWRWMQTISAIAHAPKVSARMHTHSHRRQRHSGWPSLPQRQHAHIVYTHQRTNPSLSHLSCLFSLLPPLLSLALSVFSYLPKPESQSPHFKSFFFQHTNV